MATELQQVVEIVLRHRWRQLVEDHDELVSTLEADSESAAPSRSLREERLGACSTALERLGQRCGEDLGALVRTFDALAETDWLLARFDRYLDQAMEESWTRVAGSGSGGSFSSAEKNRLRNHNAQVKVSVRQDLEETFQRLHKLQAQQEKGSLSASPAELDDRLPLARRAAFDRDLRELAEASRRSGDSLSLVMVDLDRFKAINDTHGHPVGDEVLLEVSQLVVARLASKGKAYRYGGEEVALLLPGYSGEEAVGLAERIRKDLETAVISRKELKVTASFGVACFPDPSADAAGLLEAADSALYEAKATGRNRVRLQGNPP